MSLISVIVPAYNLEKHIMRCIGSILNQTYSNFEVILVDDGSTDLTPVLCDEMGKNDDRINVFHKKNGGVSDARNYGLDRTKGDYIVFIDGDDYVADDYLELLYTALKKDVDIDVSMVRFLSVSGQGEIKSNECDAETEIWPVEKAVQEMLLYRKIGFEVWGKMFKAFLWKDIRFPLGVVRGEDFITYRVLAKTSRVAYNCAKKYYYVSRTGSAMNTAVDEKALSVIAEGEKITAFISSNWPKQKTLAVAMFTAGNLRLLREILNSKMNAFPEYQEDIIKRVKTNFSCVMLTPKVPLKDKLKVMSLLFGKRFFLKFYNYFSK